MPKAMEKALKKRAKKMGLTGKRAAAYIFGTMRKTGWVPSTQKKGKRNANKAGKTQKGKRKKGK